MVHRNDECWAPIGQTGQYSPLIGQFRMTQGAARINECSLSLLSFSPQLLHIMHCSAKLIGIRRNEPS